MQMMTAMYSVFRVLRRRTYFFDSIPNDQLQLVSERGFNWQSRGGAPCFVLQPRHSAFPLGWVRIRVLLDGESGQNIRPGIYVDSGEGFGGEEYLRLPKPSHGIIDLVVRLQNRVSALRFDPIGAYGKFHFGGITIQEMGELEAGLRIAIHHTRIFFSSAKSLGQLINKIISLWRDGGIRKIVNFIVQRYRAQVAANDYEYLVSQDDTLSDVDRGSIRKRIEVLAHQPLISVVMPVYNTTEKWLRQAIESVRRQLYPNWELCIADDASTKPHVRRMLNEYQSSDSRIKVVFRDVNGHVSAASNSALELVTGEFVALLDHDDELAEHALYMVAEELNQHPNADIIYSDEDKIDKLGKRSDPHFKSDWNPDLFYSQNYISHLGVYRAHLVREVGGFRKGYEGSQDYDLCLRCLAKTQGDRMRHIPYVLYHWRTIKGSTALASGEKSYAEVAAQKALSDYFASNGEKTKVEVGKSPTTYRVSYPIPEPPPLVSLVIPTRNGLEILRQCVDSIKGKTRYANYEIVIVDNQSDDRQTLEYLSALKRDGVARIVRYDRTFNFSAINNFAVAQCSGELVCLINNDIEVIAPDWLSEMVSHAIRPEIGAVGAKLLYSDGRIQHAGIILGVGGVAGHSHKYFDRSDSGYFMRLNLVQNLSAVTAACLVIRRSVYNEVGGLDEENLAVAFNDVDFCLRIREAGYRNLWTPYAQLYHHESASRGAEDNLEKQARFQKEVHFMKKRWGIDLLNDPYYSPRLTLDSEDFSYAWPPRIRPPWKT